MTYNRKIMRLELSAEKALNGGYYYAELLLPAADYEIKDAMQRARAVGRENTVEVSIHSIDPASEFYITIYGSIAQSESENISANVKWGKAQSAKQGNVPFQCKHFLGYTKNADGEIEIVPEEAEIIREIYERYLSGESLHGIKCYLEAKEIPTPAGCSVWRQETIRSILSNEKYKGDAIINKTYVSDCISKRVKANNGERNKYYIENNHPAIIDAGTFARVQEEIARRSGKPKVKQRGTKTELSRYSSKYALSELLICGECRTPYRRCTWTAKGKRKIVWRCIIRYKNILLFMNGTQTAAQYIRNIWTFSESDVSN